MRLYFFYVQAVSDITRAMARRTELDSSGKNYQTTENEPAQSDTKSIISNKEKLRKRIEENILELRAADIRVQEVIKKQLSKAPTYDADIKINEALLTSHVKTLQISCIIKFLKIFF
jgi:hypothetical protein